MAPAGLHTCLADGCLDQRTPRPAEARWQNRISGAFTTRPCPAGGRRTWAALPYAIGDYRVPGALGGEAGLAEFRSALRACGLKLLLDFVPNHLGLDHRWLRERPDLFVQTPKPRPGTFRQQTRLGPRWLAHGKDAHFPPWTDTVQLDYRRPAARAAMTDLLRVGRPPVRRRALRHGHAAAQRRVQPRLGAIPRS